MACESCIGLEGDCLYPYYGLAPHEHAISGKGIIGATRFLDRSEWPENFEEDPEEKNCGTYTHCPVCGDSSKEYQCVVKD